MRLRAKILEGGSISEVLLPLATVVAFPREHEGQNLNDAIENADFVEWEPWVAWHAATARLGETRSFDAWVGAVDWVRIERADDELDPSGGEDTRTRESSPASSSTATAGRSSSRSTTTSKQRSGTKSRA